jgi:hypothetical protein
LARLFQEEEAQHPDPKELTRQVQLRLECKARGARSTVDVIPGP